MMSRVFVCLLLSFTTLLPVMAQSSRGLPTATEVTRPSEGDNDPLLYLELILNMQEKGLYFASLAHLDAFDQRWPNHPRAAVLRGDALRETGYYERAAAVYRALLKGEQSFAAHHGLGIIAARQGNRPEAIAQLLRANALAPTQVAVLNDLGYLQLLDMQLEDARMNLQKAAELDQKNQKVAANLVLLFLLEGKPEKAAGLIKWYQLPEAQCQQLERKAQELKESARLTRQEQQARGKAQ